MKSIFDNIQYRENDSLKNHCTFKVGGNAKLVMFPRSIEEIKMCIDYCRGNQLRYIVIGNGSNLLFTDEGFDGVIIKLYPNLNEITVSGNDIYAMAGAMLSVVSKRALKESLAGMEFASGIPGTIGGAIVMNAGAYGGEMKDIVTFVDLLDPQGNVVRLGADEMQFGYRKSLVTINPEYTVLGCNIRLEDGDANAISEKMKELNTARKTKQPLEYPSAGSTFKRPEGYFAGKLIEDSGLKGYRVGGAMVSTKHCGFVINYDNATAADILKLMDDVRDIVLEKYGVLMEPEVRIIR